MNSFVVVVLAVAVSAASAGNIVGGLGLVGSPLIAPAAVSYASVNRLVSPLGVGYGLGAVSPLGLGAVSPLGLGLGYSSGIVGVNGLGLSSGLVGVNGLGLVSPYGYGRVGLAAKGGLIYG